MGKLHRREREGPVPMVQSRRSSVPHLSGAGSPNRGFDYSCLSLSSGGCFPFDFRR